MAIRSLRWRETYQPTFYGGPPIILVRKGTDRDRQNSLDLFRLRPDKVEFLDLSPPMKRRHPLDGR